jgi:polyvinyl alcohol dehydrogenase (cytochrome)
MFTTAHRTTLVSSRARRPRSRRLAVAATLLAAFVALAAATQTFAKNLKHDWAMIGHEPTNTRDQPFEHTIKPTNVHRLAPEWVATTTGDVSATPAVVDGAVYFGDFGGTVWKLDAENGAAIWSISVPGYTGIAGDYARTSPSLAGDTLVVGVIRGANPGGVNGPNMLGIDATTGALRWATQIHPDRRAAMTGSPVLVDDMIITGVSANNAGGPTSTFRGAIVALDAQTGAMLWRTYSMPDNGGDPTPGCCYAGATMFAPPSVDEKLGLVYGTFGQAYRKPASVDTCNAAAPTGFSESCEQEGAFWKSIVAFDLKTGAPVWSYRVFGHEPWQRACGSQPATVTWCGAETDGEKWDLGGSAPNIFELKLGKGKKRDVVGIGEKSGVYIVLDAETGDFVWNTLVGPGGDQGGFEWGTAYDGARIYGSITNQHNIPYQLTQDGVTSGPFVNGGSWAALEPETGKILWQTADPVGAYDLAPVTSANGVVYASSMPQTGDQMFALDGKTGEILWRFSAGSSVNSGPSVVDGTVYWGSGYDRRLGGNGNNKLFAFSIDGK